MTYAIRKGTPADVPAAGAVYDELLQHEKIYGSATGWIEGVYPTVSIAEGAARQGTLFVLEQDGRIGAAMILNQVQAPEYAEADWQYDVPAGQVLVLHTLCIAPSLARRGYGRAMVAFAEDWAVQMGCTAVRIDTWIGNTPARSLYTAMGYRLAGSAPAKLNGLIPLELVFYEKEVGRRGRRPL